MFAKKGTFEDTYHYFLQLPADQHIQSLEVRAGDLIDEIAIYYEHGRLAFGGDGGAKSSFKLGKGECITKVFGTYDEYVVTFGVKTSEGRSKEWGGHSKKGRLQYEYNIPPGFRVQGFFGNSGVFVDAVGVVIAEI